MFGYFVGVGHVICVTTKRKVYGGEAAVVDVRCLRISVRKYVEYHVYKRELSPAGVSLTTLLGWARRMRVPWFSLLRGNYIRVRFTSGETWLRVPLTQLRRRVVWPR